MKLTIDDLANTLILEEGDGTRSLPLYSKESFEVISSLWTKVGWDRKYAYTFSWLGRPIVQLPEDMIRVQEVVCRVQPDVIVEMGVAHGGSLIFYASLCKVLGRGRVVGIDIEIRPKNRLAIESHFLSPLITLIEGNSTTPEVVRKVRSAINASETVMVILDSAHSKQHVSKELEAYHPLVTPGSYIVATDGIMKDLHDVPRGKPGWAWDNPAAAAAEFARKHPEFVLEQPRWMFNESGLTANVTYWPGAWLHKKAE